MGYRKRRRDSSSSSSSESNSSNEVTKGRSHYSKIHKSHDCHSSRESSLFREKSPGPTQKKQTKYNDYDVTEHWHKSRNDNRDNYCLSKKQDVTVKPVGHMEVTLVILQSQSKW